MRILLLCLTLLAAPFLQAQTVINASPAQPRVGLLTTFTLQGVVPAAVTWSFGDGSNTVSGGSVATHTFAMPGSMVVRASYSLSLGGPLLSAQRVVLVSGAGAIRVVPAAPEPGKELVFQAPATLGLATQWSWGDDTPSVLSSTGQATHTYARSGVYLVSAVYGTAAVITLRAQVVVSEGFNAPFSISYLALRWEDGRVRRTVRQGDAGLVAYADLKSEGAGLFQAQWLVDGVPLRSFSRQLSFAQRLSLSSGQGAAQLSLPTNIPGEHTVSLRVLQPTLGFEVPVLHYFVSLTPDPEGPVLKSVLPKRVRAGEEVQLQLLGPRLREDMELHLGRDMAVVGPIRLVGTEQALVTVFVAPSARSGSRTLRASRDKGAPAGSARLEIIPLPRKRSNRPSPR